MIDRVNTRPRVHWRTFEPHDQEADCEIAFRNVVLYVRREDWPTSWAHFHAQREELEHGRGAVRYGTGNLA